MVPWAHPNPQPKQHFDRFSRFCTAQSRASPYQSINQSIQSSQSVSQSVINQATNQPTNPEPHKRVGDTAPPRGKGAHHTPILAHVLWPNVWTDQNTTWYGDRPRPRPHCYTGTQLTPKRGIAPLPEFRPMSVVAKRLDGSRCQLVWSYRPRHRPHLVRRGPSCPSKRGTAPTFRPMSVVAKRLYGSRCHVVCS